MYTSFYSFKRQPHKMVKNTQTIRRQQLSTVADELFECVWTFCGVDAKRILMALINSIQSVRI